ncbi:unnamed protein product [Rhodiola kirilowii]
MDSNKSWLWKKKSSEKALDTNEIVRKYLKDSHYEDFKPGKDVISNCKLGPQECDCNAKDDLVSIHVKMAEEAFAGKEIAEAEVLALKRELDEASEVRVAAEERVVQLDAALKQCTEQLIFFKEGQEEKVQEAVANKSKAYERKQRFLEEKFVAACRRADALATENASLSEDLREKDNLVEDLRRNKSQLEAEFGVLMARVDSTEKENSFLRYEFRMLEKELEIRSVEREYSRALAEGLQTQQLESVKKITKLESECQRLNALMRKRLQTPVALTKMKSEIEMLRRDHNDASRRRKSNPANGTLATRNALLDSSNEIPSKKAVILIERLCGFEDEIKSLRALLSQKDGELQDHRIMISRLSTKLGEAEAQLSNISLAEKDSMEIVKFSPLSNQNSLSSAFDAGIDDKTSDSGSLSYGLSADQEKLKLKNSQENKMLGVSDMNLMDDFVEMEKLAMVSVDLSAKFIGKEIVPVLQDEFSETSSADASSRRSHDWLQDVLKAITEEHRISKRSIVDLLADINIVLGNTKHAAEETPDLRSANRTNTYSLALMSFAHHDTTLSKSIHTIIELIEGISPATETPSSPDDTESLADYTFRVFQWRSSELNSVLKQFSQACSDLLSGTADLGNFAQEVAVVLDWLIRNSAERQDALTTQDSIKKPHTPPVSEREKEWAYTQQTPFTWLEISGPKPELKGIERAKKSLDIKLNSVRSDAKSDSFGTQLHESEQINEQLQIELETLRYSKGIAEDQIEMQKSANEDLATQLTVANEKLNEVLRKYSSLEMELENKSSYCEHLEATCLDLQIQLESSDRKLSGEPHKSSSGKTEKRTGWELATTPVKLSECQKSKSGRQLKALNSPRETAIMNQAVSNSLVNKDQNKRSSLRDQILAENNKTTNEAEESLNYQDADYKGQKQALQLIPCNTAILSESPLAYLRPKNKPGYLAIVLGRKNNSCRGGSGGGLLRRLLMRKKKGNTRKTSLTFGII